MRILRLTPSETVPKKRLRFIPYLRRRLLMASWDGPTKVRAIMGPDGGIGSPRRPAFWLEFPSHGFRQPVENTDSTTRYEDNPMTGRTENITAVPAAATDAPVIAPWPLPAEFAPPGLPATRTRPVNRTRKKRTKTTTTMMTRTTSTTSTTRTTTWTTTSSTTTSTTTNSMTTSTTTKISSDDEDDDLDDDEDDDDDDEEEEEEFGDDDAV